MRWILDLLWTAYWKVRLKTILSKHGVEKFKKGLLANGYRAVSGERINGRQSTEYLKGESTWTITESVEP